MRKSGMIEICLRMFVERKKTREKRLLEKLYGRRLTREREIDGGRIKARTGMENRKDERSAGQKVCPKESR